MFIIKGPDYYLLLLLLSEYNAFQKKEQMIRALALELVTLN